MIFDSGAYSGYESSLYDYGNQGGDLGEIIDRDYEQAMKDLGAQEGELSTAAKTAEEKARGELGPAKSTLASEQSLREQALGSQKTSAVNQAQSAIQQARELYKQIQQENIAQLSGLGLSSSSVSEALAEKLGVETARRITGVSQSLNEVLSNVSQEGNRIKNYYTQKTAELEQTLNTNVANIQQSLMAGLRQINSAKQLAATDKANRRAELLRNSQQQIFNLQQNAQNFALALQTWQQQRQATIDDAQRQLYSTIDTMGLKNAGQNVGTLQGGLEGYNQPNISLDAGPAKFSFTPKKDDELGSLIQALTGR